jgi:proliferating cell nuclear antigen
MAIIFKAKTTNAYHIKLLAELLANNLKTAHFVIDKTGIRLCKMDHHRRILVDLILRAENFSLYKFKREKMHVGINLNHFHKILKTIKKKDSLQLFIDDESLTNLGIKVIPKENNRITTSYITIQEAQEIDIELPLITSRHVLITSSEFQKMIKDMSIIGNTINISSRGFSIAFSSNNDGVMRRVVEFGEIDCSEEDTSESENQDYFQNFSTEQLLRITKIAGLSPILKIFPNNPLLFRTNIDSMGEISIYIKSKEQLEQEVITNSEEKI